MKGKNILITGASSGIGRETAIYLASQGAKVVLVARNEERLQEVAGEIGDNAYIYPYDLQKTETAEDIFRYCHEQGILLDGMVYCAGIAKPVPIRMETPESVEEMMHVNCFSFFELGKIFYNRKYSRKGSSIVAISSIAAVRPVKGQAIYAASKSAMNSMVDVMAKEFLKRKIRVNSIMPSYVATPMVTGDVGYGMNLGIDEMPLGVIEPRHIAYLAEFLLSEKALYITGALIPVTSGR